LLSIYESGAYGARTAVLGITDCVRDGVWPGIPQPTEWQRIEDEIDTAIVFTRADFVSVL
jgi:hypothetical protein